MRGPRRNIQLYESTNSERSDWEQKRWHSEKKKLYDMLVKDYTIGMLTDEFPCNTPVLARNIKKQMEKKLYRDQIIKAEIDCFSTNRSIYRWIVAAGRPVVQRPSN